MWVRLAILWGLVAFPFAGTAQENAAKSSETTAVKSPKSTKPKGDRIVFTSGTMLKGVQVLDTDRHVATVRAFPGLAPLVLPLSQIKEIIYDDFEPAKAGPAGKPPEARKPGLVYGVKLSPELDRKLIAPLPDALLHINAKDHVEVLIQTAKQIGIKLSIAQAVRDIPKEERVWTEEVMPGTSMLSLLQENLQDAFPEIKVVYQYDGVVVTTKRAHEAAQKRS